MQEMFLVAIIMIIVVLIANVLGKLAENTIQKMLPLFHLICDP